MDVEGLEADAGECCCPPAQTVVTPANYWLSITERLVHGVTAVPSTSAVTLADPIMTATQNHRSGLVV